MDFCPSVRSRYGLKKTFLLQLQLLSFVGVMVYWIYTGCLVSFFTFSPAGSPITFVKDIYDSPFQFHLDNHSYSLYQMKKAMNISSFPTSITVTDNIESVMKDMSNDGKQGVCVIAKSIILQEKISQST